MIEINIIKSKTDKAYELFLTWFSKEENKRIAEYEYNRINEGFLIETKNEGNLNAWIYSRRHW